MENFEINYSYVKNHSDLGETSYGEIGITSALLTICDKLEKLTESVDEIIVNDIDYQTPSINKILIEIDKTLDRFNDNFRQAHVLTRNKPSGLEAIAMQLGYGESESANIIDILNEISQHLENNLTENK